MKNKMVDSSIELPSLHFARSRTVGDCTIDNVELTVSAKTSKECLAQFRDVIGFLDDKEKLDLKKDKTKTEPGKSH